MQAFYYSDRIIVIIYVNNSKNIPRSRLVKFLLSFSASTSALAPSTPISLKTKIMIKWLNYRLLIGDIKYK